MSTLVDLIFKFNVVNILEAGLILYLVISLVSFNKRLKVLENLPSIKDFLRSHYAKKKNKKSIK